MALSIGHHNFNNSPNQPNHLTENYPLSSEHGIERAGLATRLSQTLKKPVDSEAQYQQQKLSDEGHQANNQDEQFLHSQELDRANTETNAARTVTNDTPYSVFSTKEKKIIIFSASIGTLISPLTTNIYFPALNTLAHDLDVSISKINLSITTYMIFQAIAPTFIGGFADSAGRRPAYMIGFVVYIAANIGLALQSSYPALMVLRCIQSTGSSGMVTIGSAIIADCITSAERGHYLGYTAVGSVLGPSLSPILGGAFAQSLGWRSIFWFLVIFGATLFILTLAFFPETCRTVVGNGSIPPPKWNKSLVNVIQERRLKKEGTLSDPKERERLSGNRRIGFPDPFSTIRLLADREQFLLLFYAGILYAGFYAISATITTQFKAIYGLNDLMLGLCFAPISVGGILATVTNGKYDPIDRNYARYARQLNMPLTKNRHQDLTNFPIERARLEILIPLVFVGSLFTIGYGWLLEAETNLAAPLVFLAFIGFFVSASFKVVTILNIDLAEGKAAIASASFNLVRCLLGAGSTAVIDLIFRAMGRGWAFTFIGLLQIALLPMLFVLVKWGPMWRKEKAKIQKEKEEEAAERSSAAQNGKNG